jgi:GTP-binding protein Era
MTVTRCGTVALVGRPNVGKSSLLNAMVGQPLAVVSAKAQATRLPTIGLRSEGRSQLIIQDLPGLLDPAYLLHERMVAAAHQALGRADLVLYLHPANEGPAPPLAGLIPADLRVPDSILPCYTKADLLSAAERGRMPADALLVSATTGQGVDRLLERIEPLLPEGEWRFPADEVGTQPVRFFVPEYLREAAFELLDAELPYAVAAEVIEFREDADPVYIRAELFVEKESQKKIVVGAGGRTIKALGQRARQRLEELLGRRVYLDTRVKVLPGWRDSPGQLARFGFARPTGGTQR